MSNLKLKQSIENLGNALVRLEEALAESGENALLVDATIQRFEFVIELCWKTLKRALAEDGIQANTPKETLKKAFTAKWVDDETAWLQMLNDRNRTSHVYDENTALEIFHHIQQNIGVLKSLYRFLQDRYT